MEDRTEALSSTGQVFPSAPTSPEGFPELESRARLGLSRRERLVEPPRSLDRSVPQRGDSGRSEPAFFPGGAERGLVACRLRPPGPKRPEAISWPQRRGLGLVAVSACTCRPVSGSGRPARDTLHPRVSPGSNHPGGVGSFRAQPNRTVP